MLDTNLYPQTWDDYIGQSTVKRALRNMASSAAKLGHVMPHCLITTPYAGLGKTALGLLTAKEAGRTLHTVSGSMSAMDALQFFEDVAAGDIVLYDEIHRIAEGGPKNQGWMLNYLESSQIMMPYGVEDLPEVTFIGATTDKGLLLEPIQDRFKVLELQRYTKAEAAQIVRNMSIKVMDGLGQPLSEEVSLEIATAASNQPRRMRELLMSIRDLAATGDIELVDNGSYDITVPLEFAGLTRDGLTHDAQKYLSVMRTYKRKPVGEAMLKQRLGFGRGKGLQTVERLLVDKGFVQYTGAGRVLTQEGALRAKELDMGEAA